MLLAAQAAWGMAMWTTPSQPVRLLLDCGAGTVAQMLADGDTAPAFAHGQLPPKPSFCAWLLNGSADLRSSAPQAWTAWSCAGSRR